MDLNTRVLYDLRSLSTAQKSALKRANIKFVTEIVLTSPGELAKKLKLPVSNVLDIVEKICIEIASEQLSPKKLSVDSSTSFTTGDAVLDSVLGGGIRTGMIWELVGESSSGKTQLALQLSLLVQVKPNLGGISGSACYLTTHATLPTKRLSQLTEEHALLSPSVCSLSDVHTLTVPTPELLIHALSATLPALQRDLALNSSRKPIKLVVIDSISALFHTTEKQSSSSLFERSKSLVELSAKLHTLASLNNVAIVVINNVTDVFTDFPHNSQSDVNQNDIIYRDQARWFGSAHSLPGQNAKEAGLGLVWANQVNARIMLTRTNRRKHYDEPASEPKRQRLANGISHSSQPSSSLTIGTDASDGPNVPVLVRRLSVVFSSVSARNSVDFVITKQGISALPDKIVLRPSTSSPHDNVARPTSRGRQVCPTHGCEERPSSCPSENQNMAKAVTGDPTPAFGFNGTDPLDGPPAGQLETIPSTFPAEEIDLRDVEGDKYWAAFDDFPYDAFDQVDFDSVDEVNVETNIAASQSRNKAA